jgi:hypothetical protein
MISTWKVDVIPLNYTRLLFYYLFIYLFILISPSNSSFIKPKSLPINLSSNL